MGLLLPWNLHERVLHSCRHAGSSAAFIVRLRLGPSLRRGAVSYDTFLIAAAFLAAAAFDLSTLPPWARWAGLAVAGVYSWRRVYVANGLRVLNPPA